MLGGQLCARLVNGLAQVLFVVPGRRAHGGQEVFHRNDIGAEELAVQVAGVPLEKDPAYIPQDRSHPSRRAIPIWARGTWARGIWARGIWAREIWVRHGKELSEVGSLGVDD